MVYHIKGKSMNWNKTSIKMLLTFGCMIFLLHTQNPISAQTPPPGLPADFNFEDFMKNPEQALKEVEEEESSAKKDDVQESKALDIDEPTDASKMPQPQKELPAEAKQVITISQPTQTDPESLFVNPATQIITDPIKKTKKTEPTQQSIKAFHAITNDFIDLIESTEKKILGSSQYSLEFEEKFITQLENADSVIIALRQIASKKAYIHLFITPPENNAKLAADFKRVRKQILDLRNQFKKLNASLVVKEEQELAKEADIQAKLKKMAKDADAPAAKESQKQTIKEPLSIIPLAKPIKPSTNKHSPSKEEN